MSKFVPKFNMIMNVGQIKLPSTWAPPLDNFHEYTLVPATPEYDEVKEQFITTLGAKGSEVLEVRL